MAKKWHFEGIVTGVFVLSCYIYFQFFYSDHLLLREQVENMEHLSDVLSGCLEKPAWLACSLGLILSTILMSVGGAFLITGVLLFEWWTLILVLRRFRVGVMAPLYALFPVMMEWGTYCSPEYHISTMLSLIITLWLFLGYATIKNKWLAMAAGFMLLFLIYSLAGSRLFIFVILVLLYEAEIDEKRWIYWALLLLTGTMLPEYIKGWYSLTEEQAYQYPYLWLPGFFPAMMLAFGLFLVQFKNVRNMQVSALSVSVTSGLLLVLLIVTIIAHSVY